MAIMWTFPFFVVICDCEAGCPCLLACQGSCASYLDTGGHNSPNGLGLKTWTSGSFEESLTIVYDELALS